MDVGRYIPSFRAKKLNHQISYESKKPDISYAECSYDKCAKNSYNKNNSASKYKENKSGIIYSTSNELHVLDKNIILCDNTPYEKIYEPNDIINDNTKFKRLKNIVSCTHEYDYNPFNLKYIPQKCEIPDEEQGLLEPYDDVYAPKKCKIDVNEELRPNNQLTTVIQNNQSELILNQQSLR